MSTIPTSDNTVLANRNGGGAVGPRPELSFNEGANITITVADDIPNNEIDVTIAAAGGAGTAWIDQFFPAPNPDDSKGTYASMGLPDEIDTIINQTILIPDDIVTITQANIIVIPNAGGVLRWQVTTNFGQMCANEDYQTHVDATGILTPTLTQNEIECLPFGAALTGVTGGDVVGVEFIRTASNVGDSINEKVHYLGIIIQGSP